MVPPGRSPHEIPAATEQVFTCIRATLRCLLERQTDRLRMSSSNKNMEEALCDGVERFVRGFGVHASHSVRIVATHGEMFVKRIMECAAREKTLYGRHLEPMGLTEEELEDLLFEFPYLIIPWKYFTTHKGHFHKRRWKHLDTTELQSAKSLLQDPSQFHSFLHWIDTRQESKLQYLDLLTDNCNTFHDPPLFHYLQPYIPLASLLKYYGEVSSGEDDTIRPSIHETLLGTNSSVLNEAVHVVAGHSCLGLIRWLMMERRGEFDLEMVHNRKDNVMKRLVMLSPPHTILDSMSTLLPLHHQLEGRPFRWNALFGNGSVFPLLNRLPLIHYPSVLELLNRHTDCTLSAMELFKFIHHERQKTADWLQLLAPLVMACDGKKLVEWAGEESDWMKEYFSTLWDLKTETHIQLLRQRFRNHDLLYGLSNHFYYEVMRRNDMNRHRALEYLMEMDGIHMDMMYHFLFELIHTLQKQYDISMTKHE